MKRAIISFYELSEEWQAEAKSNLDEYAEETMYLEPEEGLNPQEYVLWDLNECVAADGSHEGFKYNATIGISNNSAMLLNIDYSGEEAEIKFV